MARPRCEDEVYERPAYTRRHPCPYRAKFRVVFSDGTSRHVCGVHVRAWRERQQWGIKVNVREVRAL